MCFLSFVQVIVFLFGFNRIVRSFDGLAGVTLGGVLSEGYGKRDGRSEVSVTSILDRIVGIWLMELLVCYTGGAVGPLSCTVG